MFNNVFTKRNWHNNSTFIILISLLTGLSVIHATSLHTISLNTVTVLGKMNNSLGETIPIKMYAINNAIGSSSILVDEGVMVQRDNNGSVSQYNLFDVQGLQL